MDSQFNNDFSLGENNHCHYLVEHTSSNTYPVLNIILTNCALE